MKNRTPKGPQRAGRAGRLAELGNLARRREAIRQAAAIALAQTRAEPATS